MTNQLVTRRTTRETIALLGSSEAFTKRVIFWTLPPALLIAGIYDAGRFGTSNIGWVLVALAAHFVATLAMAALRIGLLPKKYKDPKPAITLFIFAIGSVTRSLIVGELALRFGLADDSELQYRAIAGGLLGILTLSVLAVLAAITKQYAETELKLKSDREALVVARDSAEEFILNQANEIKDIISTSIEPSLFEISQNLNELTIQDSVSLRNSAEKISDFIANTLRPLSTNLHQRQTISVPEVPEFTKKPKLVLVPKTIVINEVLSPIAVYMIWCVPNVTALYVFEGSRALPLVALFYLPMLFIQSLIIRLPFAQQPISGNLGLVILMATYATTWIGIVPISEAFGIFLIRDFNLMPAITLGLLTLGMSLSYGFMVDANRMRYQEELDITNSDLERELSRTTQEVWLLRQRAAQTLHGTVQASLTAANMRILSTDFVTEELLQSVRNDVSRASNAAQNFEVEPVDIQVALSDLTQLWRGMCEIIIDASSDTLEQISEDQVSARCVNEIIKECVSNAIRHGKAENIEIEIIDTTNQTLQITISNDGALNAMGPRGLGSQILEELTMSWQRKVESNKVTVSAIVASH